MHTSLMLVCGWMEENTLPCGAQRDQSESAAQPSVCELYFVFPLRSSQTWLKYSKPYGVSVPHFDDLGIGGHDKIQRIVEAERLDGQAVEVVFDQQRLVGAQVIEQHLREQIINKIRVLKKVNVI